MKNFNEHGKLEMTCVGSIHRLENKACWIIRIMDRDIYQQYDYVEIAQEAAPTPEIARNFATKYFLSKGIKILEIY